VVGEDDRLLQFKCGRVGVTFDRQAGRLAGYQLDGKPLLEEAPVLSVWRAPTDNDEGLWGVDKMAIQWRDAGLDRLAATVRSVELGQGTTHEIHIRVEETWRPELGGAPARSGRWNFLLLMLRMHLFQFWTPAALAVLADALGLQPQLEAAATRSKFDYVRALVQSADEDEKTAALLSAAYTALQAAPNPHALASFERRLAGFLHRDAQQLAAAFALEYAGGFDCTTTYRLLPSGALELALEVQPFGPLPRLPRLGVRLALPARYRHVTWFGRGPHESYPDRKRGAAVGRYCGSVDGQFVPYGRPQENGNKCDVRWSMLTDDTGRGLHFAGDRLMNFGVQRYTPADLAAAQHLHELRPRPRIYCTFDCLMSGLGNESCGPGVLPAYQIPPAAQAFALQLHPVLHHAP
jgi:hypothetical protein